MLNDLCIKGEFLSLNVIGKPLPLNAAEEVSCIGDRDPLDIHFLFFDNLAEIVTYVLYEKGLIRKATEGIFETLLCNRICRSHIHDKRDSSLLAEGANGHRITA